jgi:hypothetical protein
VNVSRGALRPYVWIGVLGVLLIALDFTWVEPGPMSIDEVTYHRMTRDLRDGKGLFIENGYEELRSSELSSIFIQPTTDGRLTAQYPYGSPALTLPFYAAFGLRGPFLVSALAFVVCLLLCHRIAKQLRNDAPTATVAAALLACTFFLEYALASWPHMTAVACQLGAFSLALAARDAPSDRRADGCALAAGFLVGLGMTLRLDAIFTLPVLAAPFFFGSPTRPRRLIALVVGMVPMVALLSVQNYVRWEVLSPLSYGPKNLSGSSHRGFGLAIIAVTAAAWLVTRPVLVARIKSAKHAAILAVLVAAGAATVLFPDKVRLLAVHAMITVHGVFALVVDLRQRPLAVEVLDQGTAVVFGTIYKKALLQSAPFLVLAVLPLRRFRRVDDRWLLVAPVMLVAYYGMQYGWHGGSGANLRYLLYALPFACVLAAPVVRELAAAAPRNATVIACVLVAVVPAAYFLLEPRGVRAREAFLLTLPIVLAALLAVAVVLFQRAASRRRATLAILLVGVCVGWSVATTIDDAMWSRSRRALHHQVSGCIAHEISDDALLFVDVPDAVYGIVEQRSQVHVAMPANDDYRTARQLVDWHLQRGRRVFGVVGPHGWNKLLQYGVLDDLVMTPHVITGPYVVGEVRAPRAGEKPFNPATVEVEVDVFWMRRCGPDRRFLPKYYMPDNEVRIKLERRSPK